MKMKKVRIIIDVVMRQLCNACTGIEEGEISYRIFS